MPASKIMVIRHAEKPSDDGSITGVAQNGHQNAEELIVRGWQRAGALVRFFVPRDGRFADPRLATPDAIFASAVASHSKSLRPQHTVLAVANQLKKQLNTSHSKGDELRLVSDVIGSNGVVLVAWEHEAIPRIANAIVGDETTCPQDWPGSRFDLVWLFDRPTGVGKWTFAQIPQLLLDGDHPDVI
jgi:hypothetical protein